NPLALLRARRERPRGRAAERSYHFPPSDSERHVALPCKGWLVKATISRRKRAVCSGNAPVLRAQSATCLSMSKASSVFGFCAIPLLAYFLRICLLLTSASPPFCRKASAQRARGFQRHLPQSTCSLLVLRRLRWRWLYRGCLMRSGASGARID